MIYLCCDYMSSFVTVERCYTLKGEVVRFSGSACKDNFFRISSDQIGNFFTSILACFLSLPSKTMWTWMWVSETFGQEWKHFIKHSEKLNTKFRRVFLTEDQLVLLLDYRGREDEILERLVDLYQLPYFYLRYWVLLQIFLEDLTVRDLIEIAASFWPQT